MVSTRLVIALAIALLFLSMGADWISASTGIGYFAYNGYNWMRLAAGIGAIYGPCACPASGDYSSVILPVLFSSPSIFVAVLLFPAALLLGLISLFRWKLMVLAGLLTTLSALTWILGVFLARPGLVAQLNLQSGFDGQTVSWSLQPQLGAYMAALSGGILLTGYFLSRIDKLDWPLD